MNTRTRTALMRSLIETVIDLHRCCRRYFAELEDGARPAPEPASMPTKEERP